MWLGLVRCAQISPSVALPLCVLRSHASPALAPLCVDNVDDDDGGAWIVCVFTVSTSSTASSAR